MSILIVSSKQKQITAIEADQNVVSNAFDFNNRTYLQYDNKQVVDKIFHDNVNDQKNAFNYSKVYINDFWNVYQIDQSFDIHYYDDDDYLNDDFIDIDEFSSDNFDDLFSIDFEIHFVNQSKQAEDFDVVNESKSKSKSTFICRRCNVFFLF